MEGRVNCLANRSLCFKSYTKGSYFGDVEVFSKNPRLFSVRAEAPTTLALISVLNLEPVFKVFRESKMLIMKRSIQRLVKLNISLKQISKFDMVVRNDPFWQSQQRFHDLLHPMINKWLESFSKEQELW